MNVRNSWYNYVSPTALIEGTGKVIFDGISSYVYHNENFHELEVALLNNSYFLAITSGRVVTCASYNWTLGALKVLGGTFTLVGKTTNLYWTQALPGDAFFYRVTAVVPCSLL
ncbi:MAG: hypothetical protein K0B87_02835 [Candidatus Syntrophosphaera sp.]|nr:hypothetical protein [Candidatus Syntrophosphaera sp.]